MINYRILLPQRLPEVFNNVKDYVPDRYRTIEAFYQLLFRKDTTFYEIGDFAGCFWLTDIIPGWRATVHVVIWDDAAKHSSARATAILREVMRFYQLRKLSAFVPTNFEAAARYAEKIGFVTEGTEKYGDYYNGQLVDFLLMTLYKEG